MNKLNCIILALSMLITGCAQDRTINGVIYESYGFLNESEVKSPKIHYKLVTGNVILAIVWGETIATPVYFVGFSLYEPVRAKTTEELAQ